MIDSGIQSKTPVLVVLALCGLLTSAALAGLEQSVWITNSQGSWFDPANWVDGLVPQAGLDVHFGLTALKDPFQEVDIDNGGSGVQQPADSLEIFGKVRFFDGSAGGDEALADEGLVFNFMQLDSANGQPVIFDVPIIAATMRSGRHGAVFNREISVTEILAESAHQDRWQINAGATGPIANILLDENRGPDGDTIDGSFTVNSAIEVESFEHVWGLLRVGAEAIMNVDQYVYSDYSDEPEFSNINPININGTLRVAQFSVLSVTTQTIINLPPGTHGRIGHPSADFEQEFISGDGLLIVADRIFSDRFERSGSQGVSEDFKA